MGEKRKIEPCSECLIQACCKDTCFDFAKWFLDNKKYIEFGQAVIKYIESLTRKEALAYIIKCENMARYLSDENK